MQASKASWFLLLTSSNAAQKGLQVKACRNFKIQGIILRPQHRTDRDLLWRKWAFVELSSILLDLPDMSNRYVQKYMIKNDFLTFVILALTDLLMWNDLRTISGNFCRWKNEFSVMMNVMLWNWFYILYW